MTSDHECGKREKEPRASFLLSEMRNKIERIKRRGELDVFPQNQFSPPLSTHTREGEGEIRITLLTNQPRPQTLHVEMTFKHPICRSTSMR